VYINTFINFVEPPDLCSIIGEDGGVITAELLLHDVAKIIEQIALMVMIVVVAFISVCLFVCELKNVCVCE